MRSSVIQGIRHRVGDGVDTHVWWDTWHPVGSLFSRVNGEVILNSSLGQHAKVAAIVDGWDWSWPDDGLGIWNE